MTNDEILDDLVSILRDSTIEVGYQQLDFESPARAVKAYFETKLHLSIIVWTIHKGYKETLDVGGPNYRYIAEELCNVLNAFDQSAMS